MATHSSILAWRIPWTQEPGGPWSMSCRESDTTEVTKHARTYLYQCPSHFPQPRASFSLLLARPCGILVFHPGTEVVPPALEAQSLNHWTTREAYIIVCTKSLQLCPNLCNPVDCSPPGSSVHGVFQARILEWVAISSSRGSSQPRGRILVSCIASGFFTALPLGKLLTRKAPRAYSGQV